MTKFTCIRSFLPSGFAIVAIILGCAANFFCETVKFTQVEGNNDLVLLAGPWSYKTADAYKWNGDLFVVRTCRNYNHLESLGLDYTVDATTRTVWAFSLLAPMLGIFLILQACWVPLNGNYFCLRTSNSTSSWKRMGGLFLFAGIFQGITLLIQSSSVCTDNPAIQYLEANQPDLANTLSSDCELAAGFGLNIASVVLWIIAGFCTFVFPPPLVIREHPREEQTVTYTQNPDGTSEESHVTIVKGVPVGKL